MFKNLPKAEVIALGALVHAEPGEVASRTIAQSNGASVTVFAFASGEGLDAHTAVGDALLLALEGTADVEVDGASRALGQGDSIVLPANVPHALSARTDFKMLLVVSG